MKQRRKEEERQKEASKKEHDRDSITFKLCLFSLFFTFFIVKLCPKSVYLNVFVYVRPLLFENLDPPLWGIPRQSLYSTSISLGFISFFNYPISRINGHGHTYYVNLSLTDSASGPVGLNTSRRPPVTYFRRGTGASSTRHWCRHCRHVLDESL